MMGISRTRSAGAKVTEEEYTQLEALAQNRGLTVGEWCRDVLLAQLKPPVASLAEETILIEVVGLRMIMINLCFWQVGLAHFGGLIWPTLGR
jgi:hypothetical protein